MNRKFSMILVIVLISVLSVFPVIAEREYDDYTTEIEDAMTVLLTPTLYSQNDSWDSARRFIVSEVLEPFFTTAGYKTFVYHDIADFHDMLIDHDVTNIQGVDVVITSTKATGGNILEITGEIHYKASIEGDKIQKTDTFKLDFNTKHKKISKITNYEFN